ncbi:MAG: hypothetical protein WCJ24_01325 [Candidatus Saccharibacteria bacterium]
MSLHEQELPGSDWQAPDSARELELLNMDGPEGPFFNPEHEVAEGAFFAGDLPVPGYKEWPVQTFEFSNGKLVGNSVLDATRATRLRCVVDAVAYNNDNLGAFHMPIDQSVTQSAHNFEKFLNKEIRLHGHSFKYSEVLPPVAVLALLETVWAAENNPILQALRQLRNDYQDRLSSAVMADLVQDVIYATQQNLLTHMYTSHVKELRKL